MKKILIFSTNSHSIINFRSELIKSFLNRNISIVICAPEDSLTHCLVKKFEGENIKIVKIAVHNTSKNILFDLLTIFRLKKIIKTHRVDSAFFFHMKPVVYGSILSYCLGLRNIYSMVTGLGYVFTKSKKPSILSTVVKNLLTFSLVLNKKVFFQNNDDFDFLCENSKLKNISTVINGSGVNVDFFKLTPIPKEISFLFVGRLLRHKGIYEYIEAARILKKNYPTVSFKLAGGFHPNPSSISLRELNDWIQEGTIEYLGEVKEMLPVFQNASVCVLPSYREGCPRSLLEAMSVGRAIITTDAPGCKDTVIEGSNGYLVPVKDVTQLAKAMKKLIENPSLIKNMGIKSRILAEEKYDVHQVNRKILEGIGL